MRSHPWLAALLTILLTPTLAGAQLAPTPAQTEGPYYPLVMPTDIDADLTRVGQGPQAKGEVLVLRGRLRDCQGNPVADARLELWQTDHQGIYLHPGDARFAQRDQSFQFYGEARSDPRGGFEFRTIMPGPYTGRPRHLHAKITPPGRSTLTTQFYFKGDTALARDPIASRLGARLQALQLDPRPIDATSTLLAEVELVAGRGCG